VLDPFGGSGSTLMACDALGLRARLVELDPRYVDVIVLRWQEATGGSAKLASGETFEQVAAQRGESG
jgi:DNA modification methylase